MKRGRKPPKMAALARLPVHGPLAVDECQQTARRRSSQAAQPFDGLRVFGVSASSTSIERRSGTGQGGIEIGKDSHDAAAVGADDRPLRLPLRRLPGNVDGIDRVCNVMVCARSASWAAPRIRRPLLAGGIVVALIAAACGSGPSAIGDASPSGTPAQTSAAATLQSPVPAGVADERDATRWPVEHGVFLLTETPA